MICHNVMKYHNLLCRKEWLIMVSKKLHIETR